MGRQENLLLSFVLVQEYNKQKQKSVVPSTLVTLIIQQTGVREETAREYIDTLKRGVHVKGKYCRISIEEGGFVPWKESNSSVMPVTF